MEFEHIYKTILHQKLVSNMVHSCLYKLIIMVHYCKSNLKFLSVTTKIHILQQKHPYIMLTLSCSCYTMKLSPNQESLLHFINSLPH